MSVADSLDGWFAAVWPVDSRSRVDRSLADADLEVAALLAVSASRPLAAEQRCLPQAFQLSAARRRLQDADLWPVAAAYLPELALARHHLPAA